MKLNKGKTIKIIIGAAAVVAIAVFLIIILTRQEGNQITKTNGMLNIQAPYGQKVDLNDIVSIELIDGIPQMENKINGSDTAVSLNGTFNMKGYGPGACYLAKREEPPCILVKLKKGYILINETTPDKTRALYQSLSK